MSAHLPVCEDLNLQLHNMAQKTSTRAKDIAEELLLRLGWVMLWSKGPRGSTPILTDAVYQKMKARWKRVNAEYLGGAAHIMAPPEATKEANALLSFPDFCKSRSEYLKLNRLLTPVELVEGVDVIQPETFSEIDKKYIDLLTKGTPLMKGVVAVLSRTNRVQRAEEGLVKNASKLSYRGGQTVLALIAKTKRNLNSRPNNPPAARLAASGISNATTGGGAARPFNASVMARLAARASPAQLEMARVLGPGTVPICGAHGCLQPPQKNKGARASSGKRAAGAASAAATLQAEAVETAARARASARRKMNAEAQLAALLAGGSPEN